jgi:alkyl sulfatase BDS1-like metallo-beta-lactamase superfamily hydrolase
MKSFISGVATGVMTVALIGAVGGYVWLNATNGVKERAETVFAKQVKVRPRPDVQEHTKIFKRRTEEVIPGVHVAIGYGLANVIVIEAPEGLIMVDTLESIRAAKGLLPWIDKLRASTGKDITDIIYTHNHADHVFGAGVFLEGQQTKPRVWAQKGTEPRVVEVVSVLSPVIFRRGMRMFGVYLPDGVFANNGIGPRLLNDDQDGLYFLPPTNLVQDRLEVTIAGEKFILQHAPGETEDQLAIFLPDRSLLLPGDNYYHAFPNLYTIRGTPYRDPRKWAASIDVMRAFKPEVMIPQHSQPVLGSKKIEQRLMNYRDAIQFVYDETIRMINAGLTPAEIAEQIKLPEHLATQPYLQEMYGRVEFAAKAVYSGTLGWFSGDPADLRPVSKKREAELIAELAGGQVALASAVDRAMKAGEPAWALSLATHLDRLGNPKAPALRAAAMRALAEGETASSVRNYYLTSAAEAEGFDMPMASFSGSPDAMVNNIPIRNFLSILTVNLKDDEMRDREVSYGFDFSDAPPMSIRIRRGVAFIEDGLAADRIGALKTSTATFRGIAIKRLDPAKLLVSGEMSVDGSILDLNKFLAYFDPPV